MKKAKLYFDFLSAADKAFSMVAVLFIALIATAPVATRIPYCPRR